MFAALVLALATPTPSPSAAPYPCTSILAIVTRPTVTTSVCTVPAREMLIESGYTNTVTTGAGPGNTASYPQLFVRVGSGDERFEYEFTPPTVNVTNFGGVVSRGGTDMGFALKYVLGYTSNASWGASAAATIPSGSRGFTTGLAQYSGNFNWSYTVNSIVGVAGTIGFNDLAGTDSAGNLRHFYPIIPSVVVTATYPANSEFFGEYVYYSESGVGLPGRSLFDYGFIHDFGSHIQVDVESGVQPSTINGQRLHYVGAGISVLY